VSDDDRWLGPWAALGVRRSVRLEALRGSVLDRYREPQRHYHAVQHLDECFERWPEIRDHAAHPAEVALALWFHDAIYDTHRSDNEALSAALARDTALGLGVAADAAQRIADLILFTRHAVEPEGPDAEALVDVDLSILGAAGARFDEYERQVRREYAWVAEETFRRRRSEVLEQFLGRRHIYSTARFRERYEPRARANLERSLQALGGPHG
jgi:predicted metal-dependent HD superfamily phosphohydrolase